MRTGAKSVLLFLVAAIGLTCEGCGGGGSGTPQTTTGPGPSAQTKAAVAQNLTDAGTGLVMNSFTAFSSFAPIAGGPTYDSRLGLWVVTTVTLTSYTRTFYQDKAETEPAGSADYTLDVSTHTLSGKISITAGKDAGLTGTYTATQNGSTITGNEALTLPSGTTIVSQFTVTINGASSSGTATETVTEAGGYSETSTIVRNSNQTFKITASDSNGYSSTLNFNADYSGTGTVNGPFPGLPATVVWNSVGTGTVTFAGGITLSFTNWQFPKV
jgi:hypothetical protein